LLVHKVLSTLVTVLVAVGSSALIWVGANLVFNQVRHQWRRFTAIASAAIGFVIGILFSGNRLTTGSTGGFAHWVWLPVVLAVVFAATGIILESTNNVRQRQLIGGAAGVIIGGGLGVLVRGRWQPHLDIVALFVWTAIGVVVVAGINALRKRSLVTGALVGAALGSIIGGWGSAEIGKGTSTAAIIATLIPGLLLGLRLGSTKHPDSVARARIDARSRAVIFLAPALLFVFVGLVVPAIRTIYLSLLDNKSKKFVGLENYGATFSDRVSWDTSKWTNIFTSKLFIVGVIALALAVVIGALSKRRTGRAVELGNPTVGPLLIGALLVAFAAFTSLRGTIVNNLWWVTTVVLAATGMGLAIAVLADKAKSENVAKAFIFMPLAISLVGASVIWRFMYVPRDATSLQTGTLNGLWVGLGRLSTGSGTPTIIVGVLIALVLAILLVPIGRALIAKRATKAIVPAIVFVFAGWFFVRYTGLLGGGIGGFEITDSGKIAAQPISFIQESPFNNFWLMVILVWIQTGFAMVILSAAIKAVPDELLEAARVDGGTPSQIFWRITLPQISTTIGVVVTTLIVLVMKVFDIVKVVTNGNFGTQVLANDMYAQAFQFTHTGRGAALAIILFLSVLPVMVFNIRRMQRES
jgi:ABC-type sugar transport system permease subunit